MTKVNWLGGRKVGLEEMASTPELRLELRELLDLMEAIEVAQETARRKGPEDHPKSAR